MKKATSKSNGRKFRTTILQAGKTAAGIEIPAEIIENLGPKSNHWSALRSTVTPIAARSP
jgi:hypothetical protein